MADLVEMKTLTIDGVIYTVVDGNALPKSGGTMTGALTLAADPTSNLEAAPKQYVDSQISSHGHSADEITSGTMSSDRLPTVPVTKGGTGATDAATARTNLGAISAEDFVTLLETALADSPDITIKRDGGALKLQTADGTTYFSMSPSGYVIAQGSEIASIMHDTIQFVGVEGKVTGLGAPTEDTHAANKGYVDGITHAGGITTAGTGAAYTATVDGITTLTAGVSFIMIPHAASTTKTPTLNVNGLGAKSIKRHTSNVSSTLANGYADSWLSKGTPVEVIYNGTYWIVSGMTQTNPYDLSTAVPVTKGGTGGTTASVARTNLDAAPSYTYGTADMIAGSSALETGKLYFKHK